jgi:hypothetical protein
MSDDQKAREFADLMVRAIGRGPLSRDEVEAEMNRAVIPRRFVCQSCGHVVEVLYGAAIICRCGAKSSAEMLE